MPQAVWIDDDRALLGLAPRLAAAPRLAVDCEANGFHAYRPRLCLIQLAWEQASELSVVLIDPLRLTPAALEPLRQRLADPDQETVMHGADYDVRLLWRDAQAGLAALFDTQIAARLLGIPKTGLAALAEHYVGLKLDKSQQTIDWAQRPLPPRALEYAAADVAPLFAIRDALAAELASRGRAAWAAEMFERLASERSFEEPSIEAEQLLERVAEARRFEPRQRALLAALLVWRETEAQRRDRPAFKVCDTPLLLAAVQAASDGDLSAVRWPPRVAERHGAALRGVLEAALAGPARPRPPRERTVALTIAERKRVRLLKQARDGIATPLGIEPGLLASGAVIERLVRTPPERFADLPRFGLLGWQIDVVGGALWSALQATGEDPGHAVSSPLVAAPAETAVKGVLDSEPRHGAGDRRDPDDQHDPHDQEDRQR